MKVDYHETKSLILDKIITCDYFSICSNDFLMCNLCPNKKMCSQVKKRVFYKEGQINLKANLSIRYEKDGKLEVVKYNKPFNMTVRSEELGDYFKDIDRSKLLEERKNGVYEVVKDVFIIEKLRRSINNANKRALQKFYDYVLANDWEYFLTLTFSPEYVNDRYDDFEIGEKWQTFQRWLKKTNTDAKVIVVPERHKTGALHFHGLMANVPNLTFSPAQDPYTKEFIYSSYSGLPRLNLVDWKYGFSTVDVLDSNRLKVANYIIKYITKGSNIGYCKKRYYHTRNLACCNSENFLMSDNEFSKFITQENLELIKESNGILVYRTKESSENKLFVKP